MTAQHSVYLVSLKSMRQDHLERQRKAEEAYAALVNKESRYAKDINLLANFHEDMAMMIHTEIQDYQDAAALSQVPDSRGGAAHA